MKDKTALGISDLLSQYIEALVEEVVIEGEPFDDQKKSWLKSYFEREGVSIDETETNLSLIFGISEELKTTESKALESYLKIIARNCYFSDKGIRELIQRIDEIRKTNPVISNSSFEIAKSKLLKTQQEKEEMKRQAEKAQKDREKEEKRLANNRKSFEEAQQIAYTKAVQKAENDLKDLISKKEHSIQKEKELEKALKNAQQGLENAKRVHENSYYSPDEEKQKTKKAILITCLAIAACFAVLLIVYAIIH